MQLPCGASLEAAADTLAKTMDSIYESTDSPVDQPIVRSDLQNHVVASLNQVHSNLSQAVSILKEFNTLTGSSELCNSSLDRLSNDLSQLKAVIIEAENSQFATESEKKTFAKNFMLNWGSQANLLTVGLTLGPMTICVLTTKNNSTEITEDRVSEISSLLKRLNQPIRQ